MKKYMVVRHKVRDYAHWKRVFDRNLELCHEYGLKGGCICRSASDANDLTVTMECEDFDRAGELIKCDAARDAMKDAGVLGEPTISFLEEVAEVPELVESGFSDVWTC